MGKLTIQPIKRDTDQYGQSERLGANVQMLVTGNLMQIAVNPGNSDKKLIETFFYQHMNVVPTTVQINTKDQDLEIGLYWDVDEEPIPLERMKISIPPADQIAILSSDERPLMNAYIRSYKIRSFPIDDDELADREYLEGYALPIRECFPALILPGARGTTLEQFHGFVHQIKDLNDKRAISDVEIPDRSEAAHAR